MSDVTTESRADADLREEVRTWIEENWSTDLTLREWWRRLGDAGLSFPTWPAEWGGRGYNRSQGRIVAEELTRARAIGPPAGLGQTMGGPIVINHGNDEQRRRWVPALARGEESWCQFFSEPGAGSDLAGLQTRAVRDGDEWVINGQKVWTSGAKSAIRGMLVARTNPDAPKHKGISYFIIEVDQPGIDIRPLKQMNGQANFNEVFFTDARVTHSNLLGDENEGWAVAVTTLAFERQGGPGGGVPSLAAPGEKFGRLDRPVGELIAQADTAERDQAVVTRSARFMIDLARERGMNDRPVIRQKLAQLYSMGKVDSWTANRVRAAAALGRRPGPESSTAKLARSNSGRLVRDLGLQLLGADGTLVGEQTPMAGAVQQMALSVPGGSIAGGTDEIQKNIIGERGLGLPREPRVDRDVPFKDLPRG